MEATSLPAGKPAEYFANLVLDGVHVLIPQSDIQTLESAADLAAFAGHPGSIGQFARGDRVWPVYAFSAELVPLPERPDGHRIAVLMRHGARAYGVLCKQFYLIERSRLSMHPVPPAMSHRLSPLLALALYQGELRCVSSAGALERLIGEPAAGRTRLAD